MGRQGVQQLHRCALPCSTADILSSYVDIERLPLLRCRYLVSQTSRFTLAHSSTICCKGSPSGCPDRQPGRHTSDLFERSDSPL